MGTPDGQGISMDLLAASLRADLSDMPTWVAVLSEKMARTFPDRVRLQHAGIFGTGQVNGFTGDFGAWQFRLRLDRRQPVAERTHVVRGISLKTEQLPLDSWVAALSEVLAEMAATSARERAAIQGLLS